MYELIEMASVAVMALIGVVMAVAPKTVAKKSIRENPSKLVLVRVMGAVIAILSVVALLLLPKVL